jgi:asparagine synthase (glutamine-hydrolysing)
VTQYHTVPWLKNPALADPVAAARALKDGLIAAIRKRLLTERPIAALLSGGLDSSLVAALVQRELKEAGKPPLETYTIGFEGSTDLRFARLVADHIGSKHTEIIMTPQQFFDAIPEVIRDIESYDITTVRASVGNWLVSREIKRRSEAKVLFNGDGSDEVFGSYLYFYNAPSDREYEEDIVRLLREIHSFDVLRSDRCISSHGLEPRTPFLDKAFVQTVLSIPLEFRRPSKSRPEKWLLRRAFDDGVTLPRDVLWRRKEAFSDGVSGQEKAWYEIAKEAAAAITVGEKMGTAFETPVSLVPTTPEMYLYRKLFEKDYAGLSAVNVPHFWMPRWSDAKDPSARTLTVY